jgi:hypothetical protein
MKSTRIIIKDDEQFEQLDTVRERHGVNWRGMLIKGAERLEDGGVLPTEEEVCDGEEVE